MKAILSDVHSYERAVFDRANDAKTHQLTYVSGRFDPTSATAHQNGTPNCIASTRASPNWCAAPGLMIP